MSLPLKYILIIMDVDLGVDGDVDISGEDVFEQNEREAREAQENGLFVLGMTYCYLQV